MNLFKRSDRPEDKLCIAERVWFSCSNIPVGINYILVAAYLMFYLTDYVGLNAAVIGTIILVCRVLDGVTDLLMGAIIDRTHTRWGKARPWVLIGTPILAVLLFLMFSVPLDWTQKMQYVYVALIYVLLNPIAGTIMNTSVYTLLCRLSSNPEEHGYTTIFMQVGGTLSIMVVTSFAIRMVNFFGNTASAWTTVVGIYAVACLILGLIGFFGTRERVPDTTVVKQEDGTVTVVPFKVRFKALFSNKYWIMVVLANILCGIGMSFEGGFAVYFAKGIVGDVLFQGTQSSIINMVQLVALMTIVPIVQKKIGCGSTYRVCAVFGLIGVAIQFAGSSIGAVLPMVIILGGVLRGVAQGFSMGAQNSALADTLDYTMRTTGYDVSGIGNAGLGFASKVSNGLSTALTGIILNAGGYDGTAAVVSESAMTAIKVGYMLVPVVGYVASILLMSRYKLDKINRAEREKV